MVLAANVTNKMAFARFHLTMLAWRIHPSHFPSLALSLSPFVISFAKPSQFQQPNNVQSMRSTMGSRASILIRLNSNNNTTEAFM